ncbi:MAG: sulfite exporter TauE/SafE family protein, partial [Patescibacteria group bacterium]
MSQKKVTIPISGMTCNSCEVLIESRLKTLPGVHRVNVDACRGSAEIMYWNEQPSQAALARALEGTPYRLGGGGATRSARPSAGRLFGVIAIAFGIGLLFTKLGFLQGAGSLSSTIGVGGAFVLGLVAAASSCVATVGGLMITAVNQYQRRIAVITMKHRLVPVALFVAGRILSYVVLGGILGAVGSAFSPSPALTGTIVIIAAVYMVVMGLDMLGIAPAFLKRLTPKMPKSVASRAFNAQSPFFLGAATFFIPCGFTQSLQIYALTTGSFGSSALILGAFA